VIATPTENLPLNMQRPEHLTKSTAGVLRELGARVFTRGLGETVLRDAGFAAAYLAASGQARAAAREWMARSRHHRHADGFRDADAAPRAAELAASAGVGAAVGTATQPLVVVKNRKQGDPRGAVHGSFRSVAAAVLRAEGVPGLFRGLPVRGMRTMLAVPVMDLVKEAATAAFTGSTVYEVE
jgi:hypothetical protein